MLRLAALLTLLLAPSARGQLAFEAVRGADTLLIVGSIHALPRDSSALGPYLERAAERATAFAFEVDLDGSERYDLALEPRLSLPPGKSLWRMLPDSTRRALREALPPSRRDDLAGLRPWAAAETVNALAPGDDGAPREAYWGVDNVILRIAKRRGRPVRGLESVKFQLDTFAGMTWDEEVAYLDYALRQQNTPGVLPGLIRLWRAGNYPAFEAAVLAPDAWSSGMRERMLDRRNAAWIPRLEQLAEGERLLVVVGAAHLVGPMGVPALLRERGFAVQQVTEAIAPSAVRPKPKRPRSHH